MSEPYELSDVFVNAINSKEDAPAPQVGMDDSGINLIKKFEGFNTKAYGDYGQYSIGYGTRAKSPDEVITQEEADTRLRDETSLVSKYIQNTIKVPLTQNQHNALVSFGYNIGVGGIGALAEDINAGNHQRVAERMLTFNRAGGQVLPGLVKRRQLESQMYGTDAQVSIAAPEVIDKATKEKTPGILDATAEVLGSFDNTIKAVSSLGVKTAKGEKYQLGNYTT